MFSFSRRAMLLADRRDGKEQVHQHGLAASHGADEIGPLHGRCAFRPETEKATAGRLRQFAGHPIEQRQLNP